MKQEEKIAGAGSETGPEDEKEVGYEQQEKEALFNKIINSLAGSLPAVLEKNIEGVDSETAQEIAGREVLKIVQAGSDEVLRWEEDFLEGKEMTSENLLVVLKGLATEIIRAERAKSMEIEAGEESGIYRSQVELNKTGENNIESVDALLTELDSSDLARLEEFKKSVDAREFETTIDVRKKFMQKVLNDLHSKVIAIVTPGMEEIDFNELEKAVRMFVATEVFPGPKISEGKVFAYTEKWNEALNGDIDFHLNSYANIVAAKIFEQLRNGKTLEDFKKRMIKI